MTGNWTWEEMLDEFRALGGVADNIRRRRGPAGWGIFPIDPSRPVCVRTPPNLLIGMDHVVFENGSLRVAKNAPIGVREALFFERYHAGFSWGAGGRESCAAFVNAMDALPRDVRALLATEFMVGDLFGGSVNERVEQRFLTSRSIRRRRTRVTIPVVELVNHAVAGVAYDLTSGASVSGRFSGEVFAKYRGADAFQIFAGWGFASPEPLAFSLPVFVKLGAHLLVVQRNLGLRAVRQAEKAPIAERRGRFVELPCLLVGDREVPERPRNLFSRCMNEIGQPGADRVFDEIVAINRERFLRLEAAIESRTCAGSALLRSMCGYQLKTLEFRRL